MRQRSPAIEECWQDHWRQLYFNNFWITNIQTTNIHRIKTDKTFVINC